MSDDDEPRDHRADASKLRSAADVLSENRARLRQTSAELRERELIKLASMTKSLTNGLLERGVASDVAALAAETGVAVFRVSFERWISAPDDVPIVDVIQTTLKNLAALTA